jgi:hypothetical protein
MVIVALVEEARRASATSAAPGRISASGSAWRRPDDGSRASTRSLFTNLARAHGVRDGADTVLARYVDSLRRAAHEAASARVQRPRPRGTRCGSSWRTATTSSSVAVSETLGGWGVQARFGDLDGIRIQP